MDSSANRRSSSSCPFVSLERSKSIFSRTLKHHHQEHAGFPPLDAANKSAREQNRAPAALGRVVFLLSRRFVRGGGHESLFPINRFERKRTQKRQFFFSRDRRLNLRFFLSRPFFPSSCCSFSQHHFFFFYTFLPSPLFFFFFFGRVGVGKKW